MELGWNVSRFDAVRRYFERLRKPPGQEARFGRVRPEEFIESEAYVKRGMLKGEGSRPVGGLAAPCSRWRARHRRGSRIAARCPIPNLHGQILASRGQALAIRAEHHTGY